MKQKDKKTNEESPLEQAFRIFANTKDDEKSVEQLYYIQDARGYVGNDVLWWGKNRCGYTTDIDRAGLYTEKEAREICTRETDKVWPKEYIETKLKRIVDIQHLEKTMIKEW